MADNRISKMKEAFRPKEDVILLAVCLLFYLLFPLCDGPVLCVDSAGYIAMDISREPLYPTFLAFTRALNHLLSMPEENSFFIAVILQSILAGFAAWYAGLVVKRMKNGSRLLQAATVFFQFAVSLLCRFAAARGSSYTDSIMTEGLGLSLFVFFILELYLYVNTGRKCHLVWTMILSLLLISLRKQMMITLPVMGAVFGWYFVIQYRKIRKFIILIAMMFSVLAAGRLTDRIYNYIVRGAWIEHTNNSMGILCTLLYSSDAEKDKELFQDNTVRDLYLNIMEQADEQGILYPYAQKGWLSVSRHFADSYDAIGYGIINPVVHGYIAEHCGPAQMEDSLQEDIAPDEMPAGEGDAISDVMPDHALSALEIRRRTHAPAVAAALKYDEICGEMSRTLFRQQIMPMLWVYVCNTWSGLINSIARAGRLFSIYALTAYAGMGMAACYLIRWKKKSRKEGKEDGAWRDPQRDEQIAEQISRSIAFTFVVMTGLIMNALVVGFTIFTQPRYMIYGMGLFYTAACMLLYDMILINKEKRKRV